MLYGKYRYSTNTSKETKKCIVSVYHPARAVCFPSVTVISFCITPNFWSEQSEASKAKKWENIN